MSLRRNKAVGVIGLGIVGSRVAAGLRKKGFHTVVWNRTPKVQPNFVGSVAEVAAHAEVIQIFVSDPGALATTIDALVPALTKKHVVLNHATVGPDAVREAFQKVSATKAEFLDAPFTGSKQAAEDCQLVYYIGGSQSVLDRVRPILQATSKEILYFGEIASASTLKLCTNMIIAAIAEALAESLALASRAGIPPAKFVEAVTAGATRSGVSDLKLPLMLQGNYEPHFSTRNMSKDIQLALSLAERHDLDLPVARATGKMLLEAMQKGRADLDFASLAQRYSEPAPDRIQDSPEDTETANQAS
jgi:3-hydroxyisobutyrate dehydrogenase-like beta-hydroxyacid dehydrogenase